MTQGPVARLALPWVASGHLGRWMPALAEPRICRKATASCVAASTCRLGLPPSAVAIVAGRSRNPCGSPPLQVSVAETPNKAMHGRDDAGRAASTAPEWHHGA